MQAAYYKMRESLKVNALIVVVSAAVWIGAFRAHDWLMPMATHAAGIDIVFIPSGVRLFVLLVGGLWAAVGVSLGTLLLAGGEFGLKDSAEVILIAIYSGFAPFVSLLLTMRLLGLDWGLSNLFPRHLPGLALGVAVGSSVLHNFLFWGLGIEGTRELTANILAMAAGDFSGSLLVVVLVVAVMRLYRGWR